MAKTGIYPAVVKYLAELSATITSLKGNGIELANEPLAEMNALLTAMMGSVGKLGTAISQHDFPSIEEHLQFCAQTIRPLMDEVRHSADALESVCADELWPYPTYQEMLFIK